MEAISLYPGLNAIAKNIQLLIFSNKCYYWQYFNGINLQEEKIEKFINVQIALDGLSESTQKVIMSKIY